MSDKVGFGYLEKLVGNTVTVFKGGPHSDTGVLESVQKDYLVLKTDDKGYVYYPFTHLKRVVDNAKNQVTASKDETSEELEETIFPATFLELAQTLQLKPIHVNGGKHATNQGYLIDAKSEYIAYSSEKEGLVFHRLDQIKSLSATEVEDGETLPAIDFGGNTTFTDVLGIHLHKWTTINEGPDKVEGVLVDVNENFTVLVKNEEIIYVTNESIHFIKQKVNNGDKNDQKNENSNPSQDSSQSNGKSKGAVLKRMIIENLAKNTAVRKED